MVTKLLRKEKNSASTLWTT